MSARRILFAFVTALLVLSGKANHQIAIFILSSGEEVLLTEGEE